MKVVYHNNHDAECYLLSPYFRQVTPEIKEIFSEALKDTIRLYSGLAVIPVEAQARVIAHPLSVSILIYGSYLYTIKYISVGSYKELFEELYVQFIQSYKQELISNTAGE